MTPMAQISTGLPWPAFLNISGWLISSAWKCEKATRYLQPCSQGSSEESQPNVSGLYETLTPHVVVRILNLSSSKTLDNPKSANIRSASSALDLKRIFSGFKSIQPWSVVWRISLWRLAYLCGRCLGHGGTWRLMLLFAQCWQHPLQPRQRHTTELNCQRLCLTFQSSFPWHRSCRKALHRYKGQRQAARIFSQSILRRLLLLT